jgi:hypothetical protein
MAECWRRMGVPALLFAALLALAACGDDSSGDGSNTPPGWGQPQTLGITQFVGSVSLAGSGNGDAVVTWDPTLGRTSDGPGVVARRFTPARGWTSVETLDPGPDHYPPAVAAMDAHGNAVALWPGGPGLVASRALAGSPWGAPMSVSGPRFGFDTAAGMDSGGRALAVWYEGSRQSYELVTNRFDPASGWRSPEIVRAMTGAEATSRAALAVTTTGSALVVWSEGRPSPDCVLCSWAPWASSFDPQHGWATARPIVPFEPTTDIFGLHVALNDAGAGLALWTRDAPGAGAWGGTLFASRYTTAKGFEAPEALGKGTCQGVAIDETGSALVLWAQDSAVYPLRTRFFALRDTVGHGWETPVPLQSQEGESSGGLSQAGRIAWFVWGDPTGLWSRQVAAGGFWSRRFPEGQLGDLERVTPLKGTNLLFLQVQVVADSRGGAVATWLERVGYSDTWSVRVNRFTPR